ncbi:hypothetical protein [Leptolyngbya sp. PCC 6406]|uniref:hypothetical protein n=1 Tax=Leptolyngbya sp. PCC 6406 TaxID=1173264 RepID=UPI0002ABCC88|nr:hypothetical protein [Leptolyngbya sp. PCC 6406]
MQSPFFIDVTSYSDVKDYLPYQVPEIWLYKSGRLEIYRLVQSQYLLQTKSMHFPGRGNLSGLVQDCLNIAYERNSSAALRSLRAALGNQP